MSVKQAEWMMLFVTFAWSSSYLLMKISLTGVEPFNLMALRFGIAFFCMAPIFYKSFKHCTKKTFIKGFGLGFLVYISLFGTITGVKYTAASTAAFLGTTTVVLVPILEGLWHRTWPSRMTMSSIALAFFGLILFTVKEGLSFDVGALYCLWGTLGYATYILFMSRVAHDKDIFLVSILQFGAIALFSIISSFIFEEPRLPQTGLQWGAVLGLGIVCSAICFTLQGVAQRYITPSKIGLIYSMEPVFAAVLAYVFLDEVMDQQGFVGACFIMVAIILKNIVHRARYVQLRHRRKEWMRKRLV